MEGVVGFGFRPTDDELVGYYLLNKILGNTEVVEGAINEVNICSFDPWDLRLQSKIKSRDPVWHFFSGRENKYANGNRQSRTTPSGKWKLTGESVDVKDQWGTWCGVRGKIGHKRVLVFLRGRSSERVKSDWVMHEFHYSLLPEAQRTYVICRLEYKGEDINIMSQTSPEPVHTLVPSVTYSSGSAVDKSVLGGTGFFNPTFSDYDSLNQDHWFSGDDFILHQSFVGTSTTSFSDYGSATQDQQQLNVEQSVLGNTAFPDYHSIYPSQWLSGDFNPQQQVLPYSTQYEDDQPEMTQTQTYLDEENLHSLLENFSLYRPKEPVTGVFADDASASDTESTIFGDTSS